MRKRHRLTKEEEEICIPFLNELREYQKAGVPVTLGGRKVPLELIAGTCVIWERGRYMGDYIADENGKLIELRFDRVADR